MKKYNFLNLILATLLLVPNCYAQVVMGDASPPKGAILDLNGAVKGGLLLSNVYLVDLKRIPSGMDLFPGIIAGLNDYDNFSLRGAMVYNTNEIFGKGVYIWSGKEWTKDGGTL